MKIIIAIFVVAMLGSAKELVSETASTPLPTTAHSATGALQKQLVGIWKLVSLERRDDPAGAWTQPLGKNPAGYFVYGEKGHVAIQLMRVPPPAAFASDQPTFEELKAVYDGYIALFGTYTVDEASHIVVQHIEGSMLPYLIGNDMERNVTISSDRLTLTVPEVLRIVAQRVE